MVQALSNYNRWTTTGESMKNFESLAQDVWQAKSIGEKKEKLLEMVMTFDHKEKISKFLQVIANLSSLAKADKLASDIMLRDTDKVIS
jgi:hypothetical protein